MKTQGWATIRTATEDLAEALESYAFELMEKNRSVQKHNEIQVEVASDDLTPCVLCATKQRSISKEGSLLFDDWP